MISRDKEKHAFVINSDPDFCGLLRYMLATEGYTVETAPSGSAALDSFADIQPDIIFIDTQQPGIDIIGLCRRLTLDGAKNRPSVIDVRTEEPFDRLTAFFEFVRKHNDGSFNTYELMAAGIKTATNAAQAQDIPQPPE